VCVVCASVVKELFEHLSTSAYTSDVVDPVKRQFDIWFTLVLTIKLTEFVLWLAVQYANLCCDCLFDMQN